RVVELSLSAAPGASMTMKAIRTMAQLATAVLLCLAGCASPKYALKPVPVAPIQSLPVGGIDVLSTTGRLASISVAADVCDFLKSRYLVVVLAISNTSSAALEVPYNSLEILCCSRKVEALSGPLEPGALVARLS